MENLVKLLIDAGISFFALAGLIYVIIQQQRTLKSLGTIINENITVTKSLKASIDRLIKK